MVDPSILRTTSCIWPGLLDILPCQAYHRRCDSTPKQLSYDPIHAAEHTVSLT